MKLKGYTHWAILATSALAAGTLWSSAFALTFAVQGHKPPQVNAETMKFWSFHPVKRPAVPNVRNAAWVKNPIDAFVLDKLEKNGLAPAPPARKTALIRRLYYDLIGLPPTPEEVKAFLADNSAGSYEKIVDRLLASPHYGERWARHWLDLVRYAETNSFERDDPKPFVWRYRDYVIKSLNEDKPYNQFVMEQLAGDELLEMGKRGNGAAVPAAISSFPQFPISTRFPDALIATGYYRLGQWDDEPADPDQARYDDLDDILATTGQVFLGLTVNCARCHDHKLDPFPQKDYYRLLAFFQGIKRYGIRDPATVAAASLRSIAPEDEQRRSTEHDIEYKNKLAALDKQILDIEGSVVSDLSPVEKEEFQNEGARAAILKKRVPSILANERFKEYQSLIRQRDRLRRTAPRSADQALCVTELLTGTPDTYILFRGNPHNRGEKVEPGFPSVLAQPAPVIPNLGPDAKTSGRRLAFATWVADTKNPLTARVMANRIWQFHFGRGIVRTPSNFGFMGSAPSHPELLDWLAAEFSSRWSMKRLHKLIVTSNTYRMSSQGNKAALDKDPENDLFWRFNMRRLDAEEIRDSILAVNGSLNKVKMFGPSIYPTIPAEVLAGQSMPGHNWGKSTPEDEARRSIYIHIKRSMTVPIMASFDAADTDFTCPVRFATTQPTQALGLMNSGFVNEQSKRFADFLGKSAGPDAAAQVRLALWRTLQREPTASEIDRGVKLIRVMVDKHKSIAADALRYLCLVTLNLNEFVYID